LDKPIVRLNHNGVRQSGGEDVQVDKELIGRRGELAVAWNLSKIYRKLGVRSRTELAVQRHV
jgi:hypothetical protein